MIVCDSNGVTNEPREPLLEQAVVAGPVRVAAVDDHAVVLEGLRAYLDRHLPELVWAGVAETVPELLERVSVPVVVLLDIRLGDDSDVGANVAALVGAGARVLLFSGEHRPVLVRRGMAAGALGLVLKEDPLPQLAGAIVAAWAGEPYVSSRLAHQIVHDPRGRVHLSDKQLQVLELMARGLPYEAIARQLYISEDTVQTHRKRAIEAFTTAGTPLGDNKQLTWRAIADGHVDAEAEPRG